MSTVETEETVEETTEEPILTPVVDLDDLFADETEIEDPVIEDGLTEEQLRTRLVAAEKRATFERGQRLAVARKGWEAEAEKHFPYSKPSTIKAESRRAFLEAAKEQDADFRDRAAPILEKVDKTREELKEELRAELEAEAGKAFGKPTVGSATSTGDAAEQAQIDERLDKSRRSRDLVGGVKALMDGRRV